MKAIVEGQADCSLDNHGVLVASMNHLNHSEDYTIKKNILTLRNGVTPAIIHFNGSSKKVLGGLLDRQAIIA
jgi:hypothetical protein